MNAIREGAVPAEVAYGRIIELVKRTQKTVFGDQAQTAWCLFVFGAVITFDSGYGIDLKDDLRAEMLVVADHFCHWAELTYEKIRQGNVRDADTVAYHDLDAELAAYQREHLTLMGMGRRTNGLMMLGDTTIISRDSGMLGAHNARPSTPDFECIKHENGLEKAVMSVIRCVHKDGGHTKMHNLFKGMLGPAYMGQPSNIMLTPGGRDNFWGGFATVPLNCMPSQASVHMRKFFESLRSSSTEASWPKGLAVPQCLSVEVPKYIVSPENAYDASLGERFVTDSKVAQIYDAVNRALKGGSNSGRARPGGAVLGGFYVVLNKGANVESKVVVVTRGELSIEARTLNAGGGKQVVLQERPPSTTRVSMYIHVQGAGDDEQARMAIRDALLKKTGQAVLGAEVCNDRDRRNASVRGGFYVVVDALTRRRISLRMQQVTDDESVQNMGTVTLTKEEAAEMMVAGSEVKIVVASSPSFLELALDKLGVHYQTWQGGPGGGGGVAQAEVAALREQVVELAQAAEARQAAADEAAAQAAARAAAEAAALRQAVQAGEEQVRTLGGRLNQATRVMRRAEESASLRSQLDTARAAVRDTELRETVQVMTSALVQQGRLLAAMAGANPDAVRELQQQQQAALGMAPVVVGSNDDGTPVLDLGELTGLGAQLQGGGAARPPTASVAAARAAVEQAETQFHESRYRLAKAWDGEETSESEGGQGGGDEEELPELEEDEEGDEEDDEDEMEEDAVRGDDEADVAARAALDGNYDAGAGALACVAGALTMGWVQLGGTVEVVWMGLPGYYNHFVCNGAPFLPRSLSVAPDTEAQREEVRVWRDERAMVVVWDMTMAYFYFRRMQRLLGRQFASEHKAKRKKYTGGAQTGCMELGSGGGGRYAGGSTRVAVVCAALATAVSGLYSLSSNLPTWDHGLPVCYSVTPPTWPISGATVTCNSGMQQRNATADVTAEAAGIFRISVAGRGGTGCDVKQSVVADEAAVVDGVVVGATGGMESGLGVGRSGEADWEAGDGVEVGLNSVGRREEWCWPGTGWWTTRTGGASAFVRLQLARLVLAKGRARTTVWWQTQGGAPPSAVGRWVSRWAKGFLRRRLGARARRERELWHGNECRCGRWWQNTASAERQGRRLQLYQRALDVSTDLHGEGWPCGELEGTAGPEAEDGGHAQGTLACSARRLRWTCCTGVADPDDRCCVLALQRPGGRSGMGQDKWRGATGETRRCIVPEYMILAMGTLIMYGYNRSLKRRVGTVTWRAVPWRWGDASVRWCQLIAARVSRQTAVFLMVAMQFVAVDATEESAREKMMLFNTRGLAVSTPELAVAVGAGYFFARAALEKLAFIATVLETKGVDAGVLLELICDPRQAKLLVQWFRARGYGLRVASGDMCEVHGRRGVRNSVAVFYKLSKLKELKGKPIAKYGKCTTNNSSGAAVKLGERILRVALQRRDGSTLNLVAWHGCHGEAKFAAQLKAMRELAESGSAALVLTDVNRRLSMAHSSRVSPLGVGDKKWADFVGWNVQTVGGCEPVSGKVRLVPMLDESEAAATRWATVQGAEQWSILDRGVEVGCEVHRWRLDEIVRPEVGGEINANVSDHAAVCFERVVAVGGEPGESKPAIPNVRKWTKSQHARYEELTRGLSERVRADREGDDAVRMELMDAELLGAAELVELEAEERRARKWHSDFDNHSLRLRWLWRLKKLYGVCTHKEAVHTFGWMRHPKCELKHDVAYFTHLGVNTDDLWLALVRRCRREVTFYTKVCDEDKARADKLMARVAAAEAEEDPLARAKLAFDMMRGKWEGGEKLATVAVGDDPDAGFVVDPSGVRREAAAIGHAAQVEYRDGNVAPDGAFDAFLEYFAENFEELRAPDGGEFNLERLLTFGLFEDELYRHARYKAVGAKVGGALSSLELIRRLDRDEREAYFQVAKRCIVERELPEHWQRMVYVLLMKKHGDQRKLRKRREIALMDQTLKLMLKCVKRLSFDRMVGRTGEDNHGWVPGHGALNAALMMDVVIGQARELRHSIYMLFLDLKQFFPAIKRKQRTAAEYFIGLPDEVVRLAKAVFEHMTAKFDTAHGLSDSFGILGGDLMGCVLSPSHARCLLTSISIAITAVSTGVRVWGCDKQVRHVAQTMMADDWAGFNTTEESLQAQWAIWVDYAMASGSPIGVAGLEKTVVTAAKFSNGKWVDVPVKLKIPKGAGGFDDLPEAVPQMSLREAYPHMGILRSLGGGRQHMRKKLRKGVAALVHKVRRVKFDRGQHIQCANCLKGSYVGYYAAAYGLTMSEAEELERIWRAVFRMVFRVHPSTPVAHFYGGEADVVADSMHGRHVIVDAVGSLYNTCRRALASPEDSPERALARSALARRARKWGCMQAPVDWLGSRQHLETAEVIEREMESGAMEVEAFDFFILYTAWLTKQDAELFQEKQERGEKPPPLRRAISVEHQQDDWGEALLHRDHAAWAGGKSRPLHGVLGESAPAVLLLAGVTRVEHLCKPAALGDEQVCEFLTFGEFTKWWDLPKSRKVHAAYVWTCDKLRERCLGTSPWFDGQNRMTVPMVRTRTSRQLWDGVRLLGPSSGVSDGWPVGDGRQTRRGSGAFAVLLRRARAGGLSVTKGQWLDALRESYPGVVKKPAVEWWDGAPTDVDRYGSMWVHVWPGAEHRSGEGKRVLGRRPVGDGVREGEGERREEASRWSVDEDGDLLLDGEIAEEEMANNVPCIKLLAVATKDLKEDVGAVVDRDTEVKIRGAGEWAIHVESTKRTLEEWKELHALYDIQVAAATDGGRQMDEHERPVASAAAYTSDGLIVGGGLDPELYPSSYECELQALITVVKSWPDGMRALIAVDARSPVMAVAKFREAHVNKRAEYYQDGMLDELLRELERMEIVVFYWLKGHSGAVANEMADLQATRMLKEPPEAEAVRPVRRHASLTFAFDRRPFRWAAERITRQVRERLREKSTRTIWRDTQDWKLRWKRGQAGQRRVLHAVQTRRLLLGDAASYEGGCGERARRVRCECGHGICSSEHWMLDCCLPAAREQRDRVAERVDEVGVALAKGEGGRQHGATATTLGVLRGQGEVGADERLVAMKWLIGSIPEPATAGKGARLAAERALAASADSWQAATRQYKETREQFMKDEKARARAYRFIDKLRRRIALEGPMAEPITLKETLAEPGPSDDQRAAIVEAIGVGATAGGALAKHHTWRQVLAAIEGRRARQLGCAEDRLQSAAEWGAAVAISLALRGWRQRQGRAVERDSERARVGYRKWGIAVSRCPDPGAKRKKDQATAARLAREARKRNAKRQAAHFAVIMGVEGDGKVTLAPGLEDVEVNFSRRLRTNWKATGRRRRRRRRAGAGGRRGSRATSDGEDLCDDASDGTDGEAEGGSDASDSELDFETEEGNDGDGGAGGAEGLVVGGLLRIWWEQEEVWFRCRIVGLANGGRVVKVDYLVDNRWGYYVHALDEVTWEVWTEDGEIDEREAEYNLDDWTGPLDREAAAAAAAAGKRRRTADVAEVQSSEGDDATSSDDEVPRRKAGNGEGRAGRGRTGARTRAHSVNVESTGRTTAGRFAWVVGAAPRGIGWKKRKLLLQALVDEWDEEAQGCGDDMPAANKMSIYRVMRRTMTTTQVASELKALERAGLVVTSGDEVRCSERSGGGADEADGASEVTAVVNVDGGDTGSGATGARRRTKRNRSGAARRVVETDDDETGETGDGEDIAGRRRGTRRQRRVVSYAESEQESEESGAED